MTIRSIVASAVLCFQVCAQDSLTLEDAVRMALRQNRLIRMARLRVTEHEFKKAAAKSSYFPELKSHTTAFHTTSEQNITIPAGAFGVYSGTGLIPGEPIRINQGGRTLVVSGTTLAQPLSQLIRIHQANRIAAVEVELSKDEVKKVENEIALHVHNIYFGVLIADLQQLAAERERDYARVRLRESDDDVRNGAALAVVAIESRTVLLESEQALLAAKLRGADLRMELNDLLGMPLDATPKLQPVAAAMPFLEPREAYVQIALAENPDIQSAKRKVEQAKAAVVASKSTYIPDVSVFAKQSYQNGVPFLVHNFGSFGVNLTYDLFDFGKRRAEIRERQTRVLLAEENLRRLEDGIRVRLDSSYNKLERTRQMVQVASEAVTLREESERLTRNQAAQGMALASGEARAVAASLKARAGLLQAELAHQLAKAELDQATGRLH